MPYTGSYVWKVRQHYGSKLLLLPAASVVVEREDGAILMMKRPDDSYSIIGGYAEEGASFADTALTELAEEAALKGRKKDLIPIATLSDPKVTTFHYENGDHVQVFAQVFILRSWEKLDQTVDEEEVLELKFVHPEEIQSLNTSNLTKTELSVYRAYLETGEYQIRG